MDEERGGGHDKGSAWSFSPVRLAMAWPFNYITNFFDLCISSAFRLTLYIYRLVAGRLPLFLEDASSLVIEDSRIKLEEVMRECEHLKQNVNRLKEDKDTLVREKEEALRRLSEQMAIQLRDKNPNIVDLNDQYRPTKLAEMFTELYDNEWTDAFSLLDRTIGEEHSIVVLLDIFMEAYTFCQHSVAVPWTVLNKWFLDMNIPGAKQVSKWLKDSRKANIRYKILEVKKEFFEELISRCNDSKISSFLTGTELSDYITKCIELCLLMVSTDPPVVVRCQVWAARNNRKGNEGKSSQNVNQSLSVPNVIFDKELFKEYTIRGNYLDYIVWPALFLHNDGPLLSKGIAQGREDLRQKQKLWTWKK